MTKLEEDLQSSVEAARDERELLLDVYRAVLQGGDLTSALSSSLGLICRFTGNDVATLWALTGEGESIGICSSWHRGDRELAGFIDACVRQRLQAGQGMPGRAWRAATVEWINNLADQDLEEFPLAPAAAKAGLRAAFAAPVMHEDTAEAVLLLHARALREDGPQVCESLLRVATQLGFALHHRRLTDRAADQHSGSDQRTGLLAHELLKVEISAREHIEELLQKAVREQAAIAELGVQVLGGVALSVLMQTITVLVARTLGVPFCEILELLPERREFLLRAGVGWKEGLVGHATVPAGLSSQAGYTLACGEPVIVKNLRAEHRFSGPALLLHHGVVSGISVIIGRSDRPFGVLGVHATDEREFTRDDIHFVQAMANLLSQTLERERSQSWLQSLIETTQDAVLSIDRRGRIVLFNPAAERIFGYGRSEIIGRKVNVLMAEPYAGEHDEYIARYEQTGEARAIGTIRTVTARRRSGEEFPIELSVTEIAIDQDVHYAAFIRDISEKTELQNQLLESERLATIGSTAAKIGHELANPLNGMSLTLQLLEHRVRASGEEAAAQLAPTVLRLKNEITRLQRLVGEFSAMARKEKYEFRPVDLGALIHDVVELQRPHLAQNGVAIEVSVGDLPLITLDPDKIKQALLNLVKNALEAMPQGGKISIQSSSLRDAFIIDVIDTGEGIPVDVDPFQPFLTTKKSGTGVGLVIVRQILTAHRGSISYRSTPGKGTTFRIELPHREPT